MTDRLRELAGKIDKATPGLWGWNGRDFVGPISKEDDQSYGMVLPVLELEYRDEKQANAYAIVAARNEAPALLREAADEIERLQNGSLRQYLTDQNTQLREQLVIVCDENEHLQREVERLRGIAKIMATAIWYRHDTPEATMTANEFLNDPTTKEAQ